MANALKDQPSTEGELDELTLRRAQRGDEPACRELVVHYQGIVFRFLSRTLGSHDRARVEDVAQETFLSVFRSLPKFAPMGPARLSTWILTIASRRAVDAMRRSEPPHLEYVDSADFAARPELLVHGKNIAAALARALDGLAPQYRAAFVLREFHEFDYDEIARVLAVPVGTVKSRLSRARGELRGALAGATDD